MQKSFPLFLCQLHLTRKSFRESDILKFLTQEDFEELKNLNFLKSSGDSTHIMCESCDEPHYVAVKYSDGMLYTACVSDSKPRLLSPTEVRRWELNVQDFLQGMTNKFGIDESIEALELEGLWHMGTISKDESYYICYFYHGKKVDQVVEFLKNKKTGFERQLVITCKQSDVAKPKGSSVLFLDAGVLADLKGGELKFNKKLFQQYLNAFREVQFDPKSGQLKVNGELIVTIPLNSAQYYFAAYLWEKFGEPRANGKTREYICKQRNYRYTKDANQFCYDLRNKIKGLAKNDERKQKLIDSIFLTSSTQDNQNGYMMQNPA